MKLIFYGLKDNVEGGFVFFFQSTKEGIMKRTVESALLSKEPNVFTTNLKDKDIYELGFIDTETGVLVPGAPLFICSVQDIRLELIRQIKLAKLDEGIEKPTAEEVVNDE